MPSLAPRAQRRGGDAAEAAVLRTLEEGLSGAYTLFHSLDWASGSGPTARNGELDIVAVNQAGELLIIEVKGGQVEVQDGHLIKRYASGPRDVERQQRVQYGTMRNRLDQIGLPDLKVQTMLVLPDARVVVPTLQWPLERIVDSSDFDRLCTRVGQVIGPGVPDDSVRDTVIRFLSGTFQVEQDVSAMAGRLASTTARVASGLATWVPRMRVPSGLIRVVGTAGCGKTQLAIRLLKDAAANGQRAAYLCFNRALADHMATLVPPQVVVETFHERALRMARNAGMAVDFIQPGVFDRLAAHCLDATRRAPADLDLIVLDEVQDLQPDWVQAMLQRLRASGQALLLEDPSQQLYPDREPFDLPEAAVVTSNENYRTPRVLVGLINLLGLCDAPIEALSPFEGEMPEPIVYDRPERVGPKTVAAVRRCLARGFAIEDIAVISLRGRDKSVLQGLDQLGDWTVRRFTGAYDEGGAALWTRRELLIDSVRRFKGQAAPAVVVTECDFDALDDLRRRLLFVAFTRARMHCEWVVSEAMARLVADRLS